MLTAIDTEAFLATGDEPVPRMVCVSFAGAMGAGVLHVNDPAARAVVRYALANGVIFANAGFDVTVIWRQWPELLPEIFAAYEHDRVHDVLIREKLIDIAAGGLFRFGPYDLASVSLRRAGVELDKSEDTYRLRYGDLLPYPIAHWPAAATEYAVKDAVATLATFYAQAAFAAGSPYPFQLDDGCRQVRGALALYLQSLRGIDTDQDQVARVDRELARQIAHHIGVCLAHGLARLDGKARPRVVRSKDSAASMLVAYCESRGLRVPRTAPTDRFPAGQVSLDEETLIALGIPETHPLSSYRLLGSIATMRTGWCGPLSRSIVRTKYDSLKETGRTGSAAFTVKEKGRKHYWEDCSRNLQNFPQEGGYRECLVPPLGSRFVISDFKGAELVTLAQAQLDHLGRSALADAIIAGRDPHTEYAARLLHIPPALFDGANPQHKSARKLAKAWNFGKPGGMGARRFIAWALTAYGVVVTPQEEATNTFLWHQQWPEMQDFFSRTSALEGENGIDVVLPRSDRVRGQCGFPDACNTQFQGPASDAAKEALWRLLRAQYDPTSPMFGGYEAMRDPTIRPQVYQCLFVHDENVTVAPADRAEIVKQEQARIMVRAFRRWCPQVPCATEDHIVERYAKV